MASLTRAPRVVRVPRLSGAGAASFLRLVSHRENDRISDSATGIRACRARIRSCRRCSGFPSRDPLFARDAPERCLVRALLADNPHSLATGSVCPLERCHLVLRAPGPPQYSGSTLCIFSLLYRSEGLLPWIMLNRRRPTTTFSPQASTAVGARSHRGDSCDSVRPNAKSGRLITNVTCGLSPRASQCLDSSLRYVRCPHPAVRLEPAESSEETIMKRTLRDLEWRLYGEVSADCRSGRQRGLRRVLRILGRGVGSGNRYEWTDPAEFERLVHQLHVIRKSL